jgi:hypothetical protein
VRGIHQRIHFFDEGDNKNVSNYDKKTGGVSGNRFA